MSLRNNVFILFSSLLIILLGSQWMIMRTVTQDLSREMGQVAFSVAKDTATYFILGKNQWNEQLLLDQYAQQQNKRKTRVTTNDKIFVYKPPSVEIRMQNQIDDDHLELITSTGKQSIPIDRDGMINMVNNLEKRMLIGTLIILFLGLFLAGYFSHRISAPLRKLSEATNSVAAGKLGTTVNDEGRFSSKEIVRLIESFNSMSKQLADVDMLKVKLRENEHYKELGEIARGLAHSIRNPLNTLGLAIEELGRKDLKQEKRSLLMDSAERQINRVDHWIRSFMTFSLSGEMQSVETKIIPVIQDIQLEVLQNIHKVVTFQLVTTDADVLVLGVEAELRTILHALIINAVEASPRNGNIRIDFEDSASYLKITITDDGDGIPMAIQSKLFQPHFTTKSKGSGMGLFMAYRLACVRYDGDITIHQNEKANGTRVELTLAKERVV